MADRYEVLAALIDERNDHIGGDLGWHHSLVGVLRVLHDYELGRLDGEKIEDAIYSVIADGTAEPFQRPLEPGEMDSETGRYNPNPR